MYVLTFKNLVLLLKIRPIYPFNHRSSINHLSMVLLNITLLHPFSFCMPFFSLTHPLKNLILPFFFYCLLWKKLFLLSFSVLFVLSYYYWFLLYEYLSINLSSGCHQSMYHYFTILNWWSMNYTSFWFTPTAVISLQNSRMRILRPEHVLSYEGFGE